MLHDSRTSHNALFMQSYIHAPLIYILAPRTMHCSLYSAQAETLNKVDPDWQVNGKFGMIQFVKF
jgi:hypothetical protein